MKKYELSPEEIFEMVMNGQQHEFLECAKSVQLENIKDPYGYEQTLLHYAAYYGCELITHFLLSLGFGVNETDCDKQTPLHEAARMNRPMIIRMLLANGANINVKNNEGDTPLDIAFNDRRENAFKTLIAYGAKNPKGYELREELKPHDNWVFGYYTVSHFGYNVTA